MASVSRWRSLTLAKLADELGVAAFVTPFEQAPTVTQRELAQLLGVTPREIYNLVAKGLPTVLDGPRRRYPVAACVTWYTVYKMQLAIGARVPRLTWAAAQAHHGAELLREDPEGFVVVPAALLAALRGATLTLDR